MIIDILGTPYKILLHVPEAEDDNLIDMSGYTDFTAKLIVIGAVDPMACTLGDIGKYIARTLRHEIVHAFMFESGLDINSAWARDETLIDWIAIQLPKMIDIIAEIPAAQDASGSTQRASTKEAGKDGTQ